MEAAHAEELRAQREAHRRKDVRATKMVQSQAEELQYMRRSWATCTIGAHLVCRRRLYEAAALRRWQAACALHAAATADGAARPSGTPPAAERLDPSSAAAEEALRCLVVEQQREARALAAGWAVAKLRLALAEVPPPSLEGAPLLAAFRRWASVRGAGGASGGAAEGAAAAVQLAREEGRATLAEAQKEVRMLQLSLGCSALRNALAHEGCAHRCNLERAMLTWRMSV